MDIILNLLSGVTGLEGAIILVVVSALVFGISKLPGPWKKRVAEVIDEVDAELDKEKAPKE